MKKFLMLTCAFILVLGSASTSSADVAAWNGHLYEVVDASGMTWTSADAALDGTGWYLATITSQAEHDFIAGLLSNRQGQYWAGGYQNESNAPANPSQGWNWVPESGDAWGYTAWAAAYDPEPNNWGGANEMYLSLDSRYGRNWTWNDALNGEPVSGYVRESAAAAPIPAAVWLLGSGLIGLVGIRRRLIK